MGANPVTALAKLAQMKQNETLEKISCTIILLPNYESTAQMENISTKLLWSAGPALASAVENEFIKPHALNAHLVKA